MRFNIIKLAKLIPFLLLITLVSGCGGGGSSSSEWVEGVYPASSTHKSRCQNPRAPENDNHYSDRSGSAFQEKMWLRSWSNETYLWYDEIIDQDVNLFDNIITYFQSLKSNATTPSGALKDQFHFTRDTEEYQQLISSGSDAGYGMRIKLNSSAPPQTSYYSLYRTKLSSLQR